jgi:hypothetical protein
MHEVSTLRLGDLDRRKKVNAEVRECNNTEEGRDIHGRHDPENMELLRLSIRISRNA